MAADNLQQQKPENLYVYRQDKLVGILQASLYDDYSFTYDCDYLASAALPLSLSLPLQSESIHNQRVFTFFDGLLPEGEERSLFANHLRISVGDTAGMLKALAGECIGDIVILSQQLQEEGYRAIPSGYTALSRLEFKNLVRPASAARIDAEIASRISLAGAQAKIGLYLSDSINEKDSRDGCGWMLPYGLSASTHIVKPQSLRFAALVENEAFCMMLANACDISSATLSLVQAEQPVLAIRRFDRPISRESETDAIQTVSRLFQEDICQIMGISPLNKYEEDGGPGLADIALVIRQTSTDAIGDVRRLLRLTLFNYLIGNCDAHAKNFSILQSSEEERGGGLKGDREGGFSLSPAYDLVSTIIYPELSNKMAMRIGRHYVRSEVDADDLAQLAKDCGVPNIMVAEELEFLRTNIAMKGPEIAESISVQGFPAVEQIAEKLLVEVSAIGSAPHR